ncbi:MULTISPECIES: tetratricopeptide repeat-containing sensor histidine kinase [unclassified Cellulophaga]|uniref:tetratricopeptide repeat-containing sensor histidine kinase n=1 Tax=unclassified Cellulophaga TaxID=2634405 RepID=UPI0026E32552|nr:MULTISPECIES: sensor histidine kinase [unclassified Cellulophaga]MDO6491505.1 sensor histidine kinase [Cellulophaga sp. 2_MG-2023]MDO6493382.1 sensor histidine kinase [Cellulophaga sp. 3_MG-2023]
MQKICTLLIITTLLFSCKNEKEKIETTVNVKYEQKNSDTTNLLQHKKDSLYRKRLHSLAYTYLTQNDSLKFRKTNQKVIELSKKQNDSTILANAYWDLGYFFDKKVEIDSSYFYYLKAQKIFNLQKKQIKEGKVLRSISLIQSNVKDYRGSEISTIKAIELFDNKKGTDIDLYHSYNNLGSVTNALKEHDRALKYYNKAQEYYKKIKPKSKINTALVNNIANVYRDKEDYNSAIKNYKKVLAVDSLYEKKTLFYAKVLDNYAYTKLKLKDTANVEQQLLQSLKIRDSLNDISGLAVSHFNLAEFYILKKDTSKALDNAKKAEEYSLKTKNNKRLLQAYDLLTSIDPINASSYAHKYIVLNDSLIAEERLLQDKFTRIKYETDEVLEEKEVLEEQKQLLIYFVIGALLLAFAVFVIGSQYIKNQKLRFEQEQQETNLETFNLMLDQKGKLAKAKQEEQIRISQELHDGVLGSLTGIGLILKATNKRADQEAIDERLDLIKQLQETAEEIRTISHTLSAASSKKMQNFTNSIIELLHNTGKASNIKTSFTFDNKIDWDHLNAEIKINLYRMIQEGVQNCVKYSKAENILLDLSMKNSNLSVILSDDGVGFNLQKKKRGIGLKNIFSRANKINAKVNIDSTLGNGTKIHISIPLDKKDTFNT